jgi:GT2 family glycosyltransferase
LGHLKLNAIAHGIGQRFRNVCGMVRYHYGRFRFRYWPVFEPRRSAFLIPLHLFFDLLLPRHWNQLDHFGYYKPRVLRAERLPKRATSRAQQLSIAVVTPSYNQGTFIERTVRSVLDQNHPCLQYAVVDGGSTDKTMEVLTRYGNRLAYLVSEPDGGQSSALVKGFARVEGDILGYLNSDDLLTEGSLAFVTRFFADNPKVGVVYGHRLIIDEQDREVGRWILPPHDEYTLRRRDFIPQETLFWRRSLFERVGGIDSSFHYAIDWDLILRFMDAGAKFCRVPYFLGCFRVHSAQKTKTLWNSVGEKEVASLRARQGVREEEIDKAVFRYRRVAALCSVAYELGLRI